MPHAGQRHETVCRFWCAASRGRMVSKQGGDGLIVMNQPIVAGWAPVIDRHRPPQPPTLRSRVSGTRTTKTKRHQPPFRNRAWFPSAYPGERQRTRAVGRGLGCQTAPKVVGDGKGRPGRSSLSGLGGNSEAMWSASSFGCLSVISSTASRFLVSTGIPTCQRSNAQTHRLQTPVTTRCALCKGTRTLRATSDVPV